MAARPTPPESGASPVGSRNALSRRKTLLLGTTMLACIGAMGWLIWRVEPGEKPPEAAPLNEARVGEVGAPWRMPVPRPAAPPEMPPIPVAVQPIARPMPTPPMPETRVFSAPRAPRRTATSITAFEVSGGAPEPQSQRSAEPASSAGHAASAPGQDALGDRLRAGDDMDTAVASMLPDRNLFITMGTPMACLPEQPINTDVPGPFRCKVQSPVYSTSGTVPLLDAGTWFVGRVSEQMRRGSQRAFAVMTRLETPQGCIVKLRAPVADQLGEAGLDGEVDTHFWERFKGLAAMAFLDAASQATATAAANALASRNGGVSFNQFSNMGRGLGQGFESDTNIPPTLRRNQAQPILVMAMQDLDMRPCYRLQARGAY